MNFARRLKADLAARRPLRAVNIDYTNAGLVAFLGGTCADVVFIDCEQGDTSIESIEGLARAAHAAGVPAVVRVGSPDPAGIERTLLRGVDGVVVPRLRTPDEAAQAIAAVRYCATPERGFAAIVQVEDIAAVEELDGFLALDGIDCLFVGPVDLAKSMGFGADWAAPEVTAVIDGTLDRIVADDRAAGMLASPETIGPLAARGVSFLYLHTNDFLRLGAAMIAHRLADLRKDQP